MLDAEVACGPFWALTKMGRKSAIKGIGTNFIERAAISFGCLCTMNSKDGRCAGRYSARNFVRGRWAGNGTNENNGSHGIFWRSYAFLGVHRREKAFARRLAIR